MDLVIADAIAAAEQIFTPRFRAVLVKTLGATVVILVLCGVGLGKLVALAVVLPHAIWLATLLHAAAGLGIVVALVFLIAPVSFVVAGFFFDELAEQVELSIGARPGRPMPFAHALWVGIRFSLLSVAINLIAVFFLLVPGVNVVAFFVANAYLFGRGFFELAALRYFRLPEVRDMHRRHAFRILFAGGLCAVVASVPIVNLLTPLFATALLVRVAHPIVGRRQGYFAV